ncbi:MAG: hypothetical protein GXY68_00215 [Chloroflexi bacterium]|nr:hypothetical protein [Chloroflexota bacterium]
MAPIEVFFGALVVMFGLVGLVRGFLRELGVTMVMVFALFFLSLVDGTVTRGMERLIALFGLKTDAGSVALYTCWLYLGVIMVAAFISYQGETLSFAGNNPPGTFGLMLGLVLGLVNGYLIAGSLWHFMDRFGYPISWLGFSADRLSPLAGKLVPMLPSAFLGQDVLLGQSMLLYLSIVLLAFRVIR